MHLTMMHMGIIIATLVCVIGIGIYSSRSVRSAAGYSVGGRSAGAPLVAGSIAGTVVGGGATVGTAQLAYHFGLSAWWFTLGSGIAFIIMGLFYAKKMRGTGLETIPQFLAMHYGKKAEELSSVISSIGILFSAVASCLPGIEIVAEVFHVDAYTASALLVLLVAAYTFFGGMKSAGIGGMLKMGIIWVALFIAGWEAFQAVHETAAWSQFPAAQFSLFGRGVEPALANLFSVLVGYSVRRHISSAFSLRIRRPLHRRVAFWRQPSSFPLVCLLSRSASICRLCIRIYSRSWCFRPTSSMRCIRSSEVWPWAASSCR